MTTATQTTAQQIAEIFKNDGQVFESGGKDLEQVCKRTAVLVSYPHFSNDARYEFEDGSAIVVAGDGWDIGFPGHDLKCWCWPDANFGHHSDGCTEGMRGDR